MASRFEDPFYGVGVEWVRPIEREIAANLSQVSCVELTPENFFGGRSRAFIEALRVANKPVVIHGIELSLGTLEPLKQSHFDQMLEISDQVNMVFFSEHLSMSESGGVEIGELTPLHWTQTVCDNVCRKIEQVQKRLSVPFMIENIANRFVIGDSEMSEVEFINRVVRTTGCGLQLDITNLYTNAVNFGFNPTQWLSELDLSYVQGVQLAGGTYDRDGTLLDNHSTTVPEPVLRLFEYVCDNAMPSSTIVEWTDNFPRYEVILNEVNTARKIIDRVRMRRNQPLESEVSCEQRA